MSYQGLVFDWNRSKVLTALIVAGLVVAAIVSYRGAPSDERTIIDTGPMSEEPKLSPEEARAQDLPNGPIDFKEEGARSESLETEVTSKIAELVAEGAISDADGKLLNLVVQFQHDVTYPTGVEAEQVQFTLDEENTLRVMRQLWSEDWGPLEVSHVGEGSRYDTLGDGTEVVIRERTGSTKIVAIKGSTMLIVSTSVREDAQRERLLNLEELRIIAEAMTEDIPA